jgi:phosphotransferase system HPr (HPr) family protein
MTHAQSSHHGQIRITDPLGLHLRPAAKLAILAKSFRSDIRVLCQGATADAKSLLDLVVLAAGCGSTLDLVAHGPDAEQAVAALSRLLRGGLGGAVTQGAAAA